MPGTILIAAHLDIAREAIRTWLEVMYPGQHILEAAGGDQTIAIARARSFDVIIIDASIPLEDGIETIRRIRTVAQLSHMVVLAAHDRAGCRNSAIAAGANAVVSKHEMSDELPRLLTEWLHDRQKDSGNNDEVSE